MPKAGVGTMEVGVVGTMEGEAVSMGVGVTMEVGTVLAGVGAVGVGRYRLQPRQWSLLAQLIIMIRAYIIKVREMDTSLFQRP